MKTLTNLWKICLPTDASTADNGSSNNTISESAYTALAKLILDLCPPDKVIPRSPTSVKSLSCIVSKSFNGISSWINSLKSKKK